MGFPKADYAYRFLGFCFVAKAQRFSKALKHKFLAFCEFIMKDFSMDYKVLIVEDDTMVAMINEQYICKNKCFSVAGSCRNGAEAMEFLKHTKVDLVILAVFMPYKDGIQPLKELREQKIDSYVIWLRRRTNHELLKRQCIWA